MCKEKPHTLFIIKMIKKKNTSVISTLLAHGLLKTTQSFNGWLYTERFLVGTRLWHIERGLWLHNRNNISSGLRLGGEQTLLCRAVIECAYFQIDPDVRHCFGAGRPRRSGSAWRAVSHLLPWRPRHYQPRTDWRFHRRPRCKNAKENTAWIRKRK